MDTQAIKKALASEKLDERLTALDELQKLEAQIKERDSVIAQHEESVKALKKREQELQETNQKLFLRIGAETEKTRKAQSSGNVISDDENDADDLISQWINEAKDN